jgi:hypothetical protein
MFDLDEEGRLLKKWVGSILLGHGLSTMPLPGLNGTSFSAMGP